MRAWPDWLSLDPPLDLMLLQDRRPTQATIHVILSAEGVHTFRAPRGESCTALRMGVFRGVAGLTPEMNPFLLQNHKMHKDTPKINRNPRNP